MAARHSVLARNPIAACLLDRLSHQAGELMRCRVDIDIEDILDELSPEEILDHVGDKRLKKWLEKRHIETDVFKTKDDAIADLFGELRAAIRSRDLDELTAILDAYEHPKWRSYESCEKEFLARKVQS